MAILKNRDKKSNNKICIGISLGNSITLSAEDLEEFQKLALEEWNTKISPQDLEVQAKRAVLLGKLLLSFDTEDLLVNFPNEEENKI